MASLWQRKKKTTAAARPARRRTSSASSLGALWRRVAGGKKSKAKKTKTKKSKSKAGTTLSRAFRVFSCVRAGRTANRAGRRW